MFFEPFGRLHQRFIHTLPPAKFLDPLDSSFLVTCPDFFAGFLAVEFQAKMSFKAFFQELKGHVKEGLITRTTSRGRARREVEVEVEVDVNDQQMWEIPSETSFPSCSSSTAVHQLGGSRWANLPPELLLDIVARVESSRRSWPSRRDLVACASVCRSWRQAAKEVTRSPELCGCLTFPSSLKQASGF